MTAQNLLSAKSDAARRYDAIIMDPPSPTDSGPSGEVWKLEDESVSGFVDSRA